MPIYAVFSKLTDKGATTILRKPDRILEVNKELEEMGVSVLSQFVVLGEWDFLNIVEAEDDKTLVAALANLNMRGTIHTATYKLIPVEEFIDYLKSSKKED